MLLKLITGLIATILIGLALVRFVHPLLAPVSGLVGGFLTMLWIIKD